MRGFGVLFGGYPDELEIMSKINNGEEISIKSTYYIYIVLIILISACGIYKQLKMKAESENKELGAKYLEALLKVK